MCGDVPPGAPVRGRSWTRCGPAIGVHVTSAPGRCMRTRPDRGRGCGDGPCPRQRVRWYRRAVTIQRPAIELHEINAASEIARLQAIGLMLRNSAPPLVLGAVAAVVDAATNTQPALSICCAVILPVAAAGCLYQSARMSYWSYVKTLELAFWVPGIDDSLRTQTVTGNTPPVQRPANRRVTQARRTKRMPSRGNNR